MKRDQVRKGDRVMHPNPIVNTPVLLFFVAVIVLSLAAWAGVAVRNNELDDTERADLGIILGATLTLLGLIIGFSFSMATTRYDERKNLEEDEANAIGTEYVRADLLPPADGMTVTGLLRDYLARRIAYYDTQDGAALERIDAQTAALQDRLWKAVRVPAEAKPTPLNALVVAGMNDVLNSQGYTQAAWRNRIPAAAWGLMGLIAVCANLLVGYSSHRTRERAAMLMIVPVLAGIAFLLIADLDSPRGGLIHVSPVNLQSLAQSLPAR